jgi:hypothetical protein
MHKQASIAGWVKAVSDGAGEWLHWDVDMMDGHEDWVLS